MRREAIDNLPNSFVTDSDRENLRRRWTETGSISSGRCCRLGRKRLPQLSSLDVESRDASFMTAML